MNSNITNKSTKINLKKAGKELRKIRKKAGYTISDVSLILYTDKKTVKSWERGKAVPSDGTLLNLEQLYKCPNIFTKLYGSTEPIYDEYGFRTDYDYRNYPEYTFLNCMEGS